MDVLAQIENGWDWYQDGKLHFVDDEGSFMLCLMNQITKYNPGIEIEFQGQLH
jgi:hypothetical protein